MSSPRRFFLALALLGLPFTTLSLPGQPKPAPSPYYPVQVGYRWEYGVKDSKENEVITRVAKFQTVEVKIDRSTDKKEIDKKETTEKWLCAQLEVTSADRNLVELVSVRSDGVYRVAAAGKEITPPLCFFKLPTKKGQTWQVSATTEGKPVKGTFTSDEAEVVVPAGKFQAITVRSDDFQLDNQKMVLEYWFAPNVGMVKQRVVLGTSEVILELKKFGQK